MTRFDEKLASLVDILLEKTREGKVSWEATVRENTFIAAFGRYGVAISSERFGFVLMFSDESGNEIETKIENAVNSPDNGNLEELFTLAQRSAYNAEESLDNLLRELQRI